MKSNISGRRAFSPLFAVTILTLTVSGCAFSPITYGTGESAEVALAKDVANLVTFGAVGKTEKKRILYNERGALVIPPEGAGAQIPRPIQSVDEVGDNFPGRAEEIERAKRKEETRKAKAVPNNIIGSPNAQPLAGTGDQLDSEFNNRNKKKNVIDGDQDGPIYNARIGDNSVPDARRSLKTREDLAKELGVPVESLPDTIENRSLLERAGLVRRSTTNRGQRLTDVPIEYRTVESDTGTTQEASDLLSDKKKKKKKRFLLF